MEKKTTLIIIPAYNEAQTIAKVVTSCIAAGYHVLVVNDASSDNTLTLALNAGAKAISMPFRCGAWLAIQTGLQWAFAQAYTLAVTLDGDGQHLSNEIPLLIEPVLKNNADIVIGSSPSRLGKGKTLVNGLLRCVSGLPIQDITSGMKAYSTRAIAFFAQAGTMLDYQDVGALLLAKEEGLIITEKSVTMKERQYGRSKIFASPVDIINYTLSNVIFCLLHPNVTKKRI